MKRYYLITIAGVVALVATALASNVTYPMQVLLFTFILLFCAVVLKALVEMLHGGHRG